ncbi:MAG TPA: NAD(P)-dependent oxidoreductase [Syntrophales bacterium]|nr:NAD(P)-dependent oxidoreductase [Syntrophales bacterium]
MKKIGWIGTGVMGKSMCLHILKKGYQLSVFNRAREKSGELCKQGATWFDTPGDVAAASDVTFTMVGEPPDVKQVILGKGGVLEGSRSGAAIVDMTTSEPSLARIIYEEAKKRAVSSLDAPVSGGDVGAREGTLAIMVGGDEDVFKRVLPVFELMGKNIAHMGGPGMGQHTKMSNQIAIAGNMVGVVESLLYARRAGLDPDAVIDIIGKGAAASWSLNQLGRRIIKGDFAPGFYIRHFVKDMGIALLEARKMKLSLPGLAVVNQFYTAAIAEGLETDGTQALYKVLDRLNRP